MLVELEIHRGKITRKWIKRRQRKGCFNNIVKRLEDTKGYEEVIRVNFDSLKFILMKIEKDIALRS